MEVPDQLFQEVFWNCSEKMSQFAGQINHNGNVLFLILCCPNAGHLEKCWWISSFLKKLTIPWKHNFNDQIFRSACTLQTNKSKITQIHCISLHHTRVLMMKFHRRLWDWSTGFLRVINSTENKASSIPSWQVHSFCLLTSVSPRASSTSLL